MVSKLRPPSLLPVLAFSLIAACGLREMGGPSSGSASLDASAGTSATGSSGNGPSGSGPAGSGASGNGTPDAALSRGDGQGGTPAVPGAGVDASVPAPTPSAGVVIAGVMHPRNEVIVFLHIGHSNMAGRASGPESLRPFNYDTDPQLWSYGPKGFAPAKEPLSPDVMTAGRAGPGMSILRTALAAAPKLTMVSIGHGHSGTLGGYCSSYRRGGLLYDLVMKPAQALKGNVTFGAIFTMLGITEVDAPATINNFTTCLQSVVSEMRADLGEPDLPVMVGDWEVGATDQFVPTGQPAMIIIPQLHAAVAAIPRSALISSAMLEMTDGHHYNFAGHKLWAERGFALLKERGWMPWAPPPP